MTQPTTLLKTPLTEWHRAHGGQLADFGGFAMPVQYSAASDEHRAVRTRAGLFDLSHLGQVEVAGKDALTVVQRTTSNDAGRLRPGQTQRSALTTPSGAFVDDVVVSRLGRDHFLLLVSAANVSKDIAWVTGQSAAFADLAVVNTTSRYALVALDGPLAAETLQSATGVELDALEPGSFSYGEVAGARATISRTTITGEDGFQISSPPQQALRVWQALLQAGADAGVVPVGLAARDTLRLEAGVPAYPPDLDDTTSVLEAGLECIVAWDKGDFTGRDALARERSQGLRRRLVGFEMMENGVVASRGDVAVVEGREAGGVTSGGLAPFLDRAVGLVYLPIEKTGPGSEFEIDVGGRRAGARVVPLPFYTRSKG